MTTPTPTPCSVCGEHSPDPRLLSECVNCARPFHLNPYNSGDHLDCGDAMLGQSMGVEFWCNPCLTGREEAERAAGLDDPRAVLDRLSGVDQLFQPLPPVPTPPHPTAAPEPAPPPPRRKRRPAERRRYRRIDGQ